MLGCMDSNDIIDGDLFQAVFLSSSLRLVTIREYRFGIIDVRLIKLVEKPISFCFHMSYYVNLMAQCF